MANTMQSGHLLFLVLFLVLPTGIVCPGCSTDVEIPGATSLCFLFSGVGLTFFEANALCEHMSYEPMYADTQDTETNLLSALMIHGVEGDYWLGGNDLFVEGVWYWHDFEYFINQQSYDNWAEGRPVYDKKSNCLYIRFDGSTTMWYDGECSSEKFAVCYN
ncbi:hypothetical protein ScPMuIL_014525 [Solemya velum]